MGEAVAWKSAIETQVRGEEGGRETTILHITVYYMRICVYVCGYVCGYVFQIARLECMRKPALPPCADPRVLSDILGVGGQFSYVWGADWRLAAYAEGVRIMEHVSPVTGHICRRAQACHLSSLLLLGCWGHGSEFIDVYMYSTAVIGAGDGKQHAAERVPGAHGGALPRVAQTRERIDEGRQRDMISANPPACLRTMCGHGL